MQPTSGCADPFADCINTNYPFFSASSVYVCSSQACKRHNAMVSPHTQRRPNRCAWRSTFHEWFVALMTIKVQCAVCLCVCIKGQRHEQKWVDAPQANRKSYFLHSIVTGNKHNINRNPSKWAVHSVFMCSMCRDVCLPGPWQNCHYIFAISQLTGNGTCCLTECNRLLIAFQHKTNTQTQSRKDSVVIIGHYRRFKETIKRNRHRRIDHLSICCVCWWFANCNIAQEGPPYLHWTNPTNLWSTPSYAFTHLT